MRPHLMTDEQFAYVEACIRAKLASIDALAEVAFLCDVVAELRRFREADRAEAHQRWLNR